MTEVMFASMSSPRTWKFGSCGRPLPNFSVKVIKIFVLS